MNLTPHKLVPTIIKMHQVFIHTINCDFYCKSKLPKTTAPLTKVSLSNRSSELSMNPHIVWMAEFPKWVPSKFFVTLEQVSVKLSTLIVWHNVIKKLLQKLVKVSLIQLCSQPSQQSVSMVTAYVKQSIGSLPYDKTASKSLRHSTVWGKDSEMQLITQTFLEIIELFTIAIKKRQIFLLTELFRIICPGPEMYCCI